MPGVPQTLLEKIHSGTKAGDIEHFTGITCGTGRKGVAGAANVLATES